MSMVQELDDSFDAAMFVGYHSKAGDETNPLAHTMTLRVMRMRINGEPVSEFVLYSYAAAYVGVPVVFVSGDKGICADSRATTPTSSPWRLGGQGAVDDQHPAALGCEPHPRGRDGGPERQCGRLQGQAAEAIQARRRLCHADGSLSKRLVSRRETCRAAHREICKSRDYFEVLRALRFIA